jgi:hypothetical protein
VANGLWYLRTPNALNRESPCRRLAFLADTSRYDVLVTATPAGWRETLDPPELALTLNDSSH